jgi:hypothetical protein
MMDQNYNDIVYTLYINLFTYSGSAGNMYTWVKEKWE